VSEGGLRRRRETRTQTALTPEERAANLAGAFVGSGPRLELPVLVDDVFTTGATLAEAARALLAQGSPAVAGITFARAPRPLADAMAAPERDRVPFFWRRA
jgi:predicted amidophosphoribosyltransferase